jgi:adenylate cyclase
MEQPGSRRRLAAILFADAAGFSRLMGIDEAATLATLASSREILQSKVTEHGGRIVGSAGDGFLAEFGSVVDAVNSAVEVQRAFAAQNAALPDARRLRFRIGINLGDVIAAGDDIFGDGVNMASRLEKLAEPGGICISGDVYNQVKNKLPLNYIDLGDQALKNLAQPVRVYRIGLGPSRPTTGASVGTGAFPALQLPSKPSLAVLPLRNANPDPEQMHVSDGVSEELLFELSRLKDLFVVARNSSFMFRDYDGEQDEIGLQLGVQHLVTGRVEVGEEGLLLTVHMIDAPSGQVVWSFERACGFPDIFEAYGDIVQGIATTLLGPVDEATLAHSRRPRTTSAEAYEILLKGRELFSHINPTDDARARQTFSRVVELDPRCAQAFAMLAVTHMYEYRQTRHNEAAERAVKTARAALALDDDESIAHQVMGYIHLYRKRFLQAQFHMAKALGLDSSDSVAIVRMGLLHCYLGKPVEALDYFQRSSRLNPCHPGRYLGVRGMAHFIAREYMKSVESLEKLAMPYYWDRAYLAASYAMLGRVDDARAKLAEVLQVKPSYALDQLAMAEPFQSPADLDHFLSAMRRAGLPG